MLTSRVWMRIVAAGLCAAGIVATALATRGLQDGLGELPRHWWSAPAPLPLVAAAVLLAVGEHARRRSHHLRRGTPGEE